MTTEDVGTNDTTAGDGPGAPAPPTANTGYPTGRHGFTDPGRGEYPDQFVTEYLGEPDRDLPPGDPLNPDYSASGDDHGFGGDQPPLFIAGPCVIESRQHALAMARTIRKLRDEMRVNIVFKSSFDKANRTSIESFRGPGLDEGLEILRAVKEETGLPVLSDIHEWQQAESEADYLIGKLTDPDDLVVDPFCGSGTVLTAAKKLGGRWLGVELDRGVARSARRRLAA